MTTPLARMLGPALLLLFLASPGAARTIILTDAECDQIAVICQDAPRLSWAGYESATGVFDSYLIDLFPNKAVLIRFPLEKIPKGQRITRAELMFPVSLTAAGEQKLQVRRLLADWGPGVCYQYRMARPGKVEWKEAGARGANSDRSARPSAVARIAGMGETLINLTEDVELWYTGSGKNFGWMLTVDEEGGFIRLASPVGQGKEQWKLRITFEPE